MPSSPTPNVYGYNAEATDYDTGLQYLRARYYDTGIQRFVQEDDYRGSYTNPISMNRYAYVYNNPVMGVDPSGYARTSAMLIEGEYRVDPYVGTYTPSVKTVHDENYGYCDDSLLSDEEMQALLPWLEMMDSDFLEALQNVTSDDNLNNDTESNNNWEKVINELDEEFGFSAVLNLLDIKKIGNIEILEIGGLAIVELSHKRATSVTETVIYENEGDYYEGTVSLSKVSNKSYTPVFTEISDYFSECIGYSQDNKFYATSIYTDGVGVGADIGIKINDVVYGVTASIDANENISVGGMSPKSFEIEGKNLSVTDRYTLEVNTGVAAAAELIYYGAVEAGIMIEELIETLSKTPAIS